MPTPYQNVPFPDTVGAAMPPAPDTNAAPTMPPEHKQILQALMSATNEYPRLEGRAPLRESEAQDLMRRIFEMGPDKLTTMTNEDLEFWLDHATRKRLIPTQEQPVRPLGRGRRGKSDAYRGEVF